MVHLGGKTNGSVSGTVPLVAPPPLNDLKKEPAPEGGAVNLKILVRAVFCLAPYIRPLIFGFSNRVFGAGGRMFNA